MARAGTVTERGSGGARQRRESATGLGESGDRALTRIIAQFNLVARRQERVKAENKGTMTGEQVRYALNNLRRVDGLGFELLHDVQEVIVNMRALDELGLDLLEIGKRVLDLQLAVASRVAALSRGAAGDHDDLCSIGRASYHARLVFDDRDSAAAAAASATTSAPSASSTATSASAAASASASTAIADTTAAAATTATAAPCAPAYDSTRANAIATTTAIAIAIASATAIASVVGTAAHSANAAAASIAGAHTGAWAGAGASASLGGLHRAHSAQGGGRRRGGGGGAAGSSQAANRAGPLGVTLPATIRRAPSIAADINVAPPAGAAIRIHAQRAAAAAAAAAAAGFIPSHRRP